MQVEGFLSSVGPAILAGAALAVAFLVAIGLAKKFLHICPPNEVLIFSGRRNLNADGSSRGFRVIMGGRGWRVPLFETVDRMSLNVTEIPISVRSAYSKGGVPLNVDAIANVKISSHPGLIGNAIERFLGQSPQMVARVAKETLEGHLRGVLATLTPEEVNEDRLKFADNLAKESQEDFNKLGLHMDTLTFQNVSDESSYLDSLGREAIAHVIRDAEMAESDAKREAEQSESEHQARANVTRANAEAAIARLRNELRRVQAELLSKVNSEEERTEAAAREARATAEQQLQRVRAQLAQIRLQTDRVLPAEADRIAKEFAARGEAARIRERGVAVAQAMDLMNEAWAKAGDHAIAIHLIEDLENILRAAARGVNKVKVEDVSMIDGGDGKALSAYVAAYPEMLSSVFAAVAKTTGIDIPEIVSGRHETRPRLGTGAERARGEDESTKENIPAV
jgi:flotillin